MGFFDVKASEKKSEAERLYIREGYAAGKIAALVGSAPGTVYRWVRDGGWKEKRESYTLSPLAMRDRYFELVKGLLAEAEANEEIRNSAAFADAMNKHFTALKKLDPPMLLKGVIHDFIRVSSDVIGERDAELARRLLPYWDEVREKLIDYFEKKSVL